MVCSCLGIFDFVGWMGEFFIRRRTTFDRLFKFFQVALSPDSNWGYEKSVAHGFCGLFRGRVLVIQVFSSWVESRQQLGVREKCSTWFLVEGLFIQGEFKF